MIPFVCPTAMRPFLLISIELMLNYSFFLLASFLLLLSHFISSLSCPPVINSFLLPVTPNPHNYLSKCPSITTVAELVFCWTSTIQPPLVPTNMFPNPSQRDIILGLFEFMSFCKFIYLYFDKFALHSMITPVVSPDIIPPYLRYPMAVTGFKCYLYTLEQTFPFQQPITPFPIPVTIASPANAMQ